MNYPLLILSLLVAILVALIILPFAVLSYKAEGVEIKTISEVLEGLAMCESSNNPKAFNRFDGGSPSYGLYQFKLSTFNHFGERYGLKHTDVMNPKQQEAIARMMLSEGRYSHWYNCLVK